MARKISKYGLYELYYSTGGHGGPYKDLRTARAAAKRLLKGNPNERYIRIVTRSTGKTRETVRRK